MVVRQAPGWHWDYLGRLTLCLVVTSQFYWIAYSDMAKARISILLRLPLAHPDLHLIQSQSAHLR